MNHMMIFTFHETGISSLLLWQNVALGPVFHWAQGYDPTHHWWLSTTWAALPLLVLLTAIVGLKLKAHRAALIVLTAALAIAIFVFHMPVKLAGLATIYGAGYGLFPIFWIIFPVIFMYQMTVKAGRFGLLQQCLTGITEDSRLQLLLIAFCLGAFFEGAAGFGTPVAGCGTILLGLGLKPVQAAGLALLANTAPVAFGGLGIPIVALHGVTGLDTLVLTRVGPNAADAVLHTGPVLADLGVCGFHCDVRGVACNFGGGSYVWIYAIGRCAAAWTVAGRHLRIGSHNRSAGTVPARVWKTKRILNARCEDVTHLSRRTNTGRADVVMRAALPWIILTAFVTLWERPSSAYGLMHSARCGSMCQAWLRLCSACRQSCQKLSGNLQYLSSTGLRQPILASFLRRSRWDFAGATLPARCCIQ
jgi:lactate permease